MNLQSTWRWMRRSAVLASAVLLCPGVSGAEQLSVDDLFSRAAAAQQARGAYAFTAEDREFYGQLEPGKVVEPNQRIEFDVMMAGEKMSVRSILHMKDRESGEMRPHVDSRYVWDGQLYWRTSHNLFPGEVPWTQVEEGTYYRDRQRTNPDYGAFLEGYFMHNYNGPWYEMLAEEPSAHIASQPEQMNGAPCLVLTASTSHGDYRLWIDPEAGYLVRAADITLTQEDMAWGAPLGDSHKATGGRQLDALHFELRDVEIVPMNDSFMGSAGTFVQRFQYADGSVSTATKVVRRSNLRQLPEGEIASAFQLPLEDGDRVEYKYANGTALDHRWVQGKLEPVLDKETLAHIAGSLDELSTLAEGAGTLAALQPKDAAADRTDLIRTAWSTVTSHVWLLGIALVALGALSGMGWPRKGHH